MNDRPSSANAIEAAIESFIAAAGQRGRLAEATLDAYRRDLVRLSRWCRKRGIERLSELDAARLREFTAGLARNGLDPRSIQRQLSALRTFFGHLHRSGSLGADPAADLRAPRARRKLPRTLDPDAVSRLLDIPGDRPIDLRDRALLELCYSSGLRVSELADTRWDRLDPDEGILHVIGKGDKERVVPVGRHALAALSAWREVCARLGWPPSEFVFVTARGRPMTVRAIQKRIALRAREQGLDQHVHPHQLRHSFASHILESSGDLRAVQELLGHANLSTTQVYTHLDFQHLAEVYDQAHPRARRKQRGRRD